MVLMGNRWFVVVLFFMFSLASCAVNNNLVIENTGGYPEVFTIKGHQLTFPAESEVQFDSLYGAPWELSGDIATLENSAVVELDSKTDLVFPKVLNTQFQVKNITIKAGSFMTDGSHTHLSLSLDMSMMTIKNGLVNESCQIPTVHLKLDEPVNHGLFAGRDRIRDMVLPAYEELISKALTEALVAGFKCLSEKAK